MTHRKFVLAMGMIAAALPVPAAGQAPAGTPATKYCMRIEAVTGSRIEELKCWTRDEWAERGVDVDKDWAKEGVRTVG